MKEIRIYSDESRHTAERFLLLSGIWIEENHIETAESAIQKIREHHGYTNSKGERVDFCGELKWTKISDRYFEVYAKVVDQFFEWIEKDIARYCCIMLDTHDPMVAARSNIKGEGYFKLLYQLYYHNSKMPGTYKIFPDQITNPIQHNVDFEELGKCLENAFRSKFISMMNPSERSEIEKFVNNITPINSKDSDLLQVVDIIMGALGYFQNRLFKSPGAKPAKVKLMKRIIEKLVYSGIFKIESKQFMIARSTKFNIWVFRPNKKDPC